MNRTRFFVLVGTLLTASTFALLLTTFFRRAPVAPGSIPVRGGERFDLKPGPDRLHFGQADPVWAEHRIGGSSESIRAVGCTLCCVAMALEAEGIQTDPGRLNLALIEADGYTKDGWIKWGAVESVSGNRVVVTVHETPSHLILDDNLKAGRHSLAKFILPFGIPHWVLVCGKRGDDYLILDPALSTPGPVQFSTRSRSIVALRTIAAVPRADLSQNNSTNARP